MSVESSAVVMAELWAEPRDAYSAVLTVFAMADMSVVDWGALMAAWLVAYLDALKVVRMDAG